MATSIADRRQRQLTVEDVIRDFEVLSIDSEVGYKFAELVSGVRRAKMRANINDAWIAATAIRNNLPVYTQDDDFLEFPGLTVYRV